MLTDRGREILAEARAKVDGIERLLADAVGPNDLARFRDLLSRCASRLASG